VVEVSYDDGLYRIFIQIIRPLALGRYLLISY
jgi:hypothetical protein